VETVPVTLTKPTCRKLSSVDLTRSCVSKYSVGRARLEQDPAFVHLLLGGLATSNPAKYIYRGLLSTDTLSRAPSNGAVSKVLQHPDVALRFESKCCCRANRAATELKAAFCIRSAMSRRPISPNWHRKSPYPREPSPAKDQGRQSDG